MEDNHIDALIDMLNWNFRDIEKQKIAMAMLKRKITKKQFSRLIMPYEKEYWLNASKVICEIDEDMYRKNYTKLLEWIKDFDIPGARNIFERLLEINFYKYEYEFNQIMDYAKRINDKVWVENLDLLSRKAK